MIKVSSFIMNFLAVHGVKNVFMLPGGGAMHLVDSLGRQPKLKAISYLHEQAAAIAADAEAQYTGGLGVVLVTTGPGATNAITAAAASWIDGTPVLFISGQAKRCDISGLNGPRQKGVQEVDIVRMVSGITKYAITIMKPEEIKFHLEKALWLAMHGRKGPVWLDIPLDVQGAFVKEQKLLSFTPPLEQEDSSQIQSWAQRTADLLKKADRPVILAGSGIRQAGAQKEFLALAEKLQVPVLTTWRAADFYDEKDDIYFGRPGAMASRDANFILQNSDFLLSIGARLDLPQIGHNYAMFAREAKKIIVEIDSREIDKLQMPLDIKALCSADIFIKEFSKLAEKKDCSKWLAYCNKVKKAYRGKFGYLPVKTGAVNTYDFINALSEEMKHSDVLVPGSSGSCAEITMQAFKVKKGQRILNTPGLGSMGFGLPAASGAAIASGKRVITIIGDGGLQHNVQALQTIHRLNLNIKIFILDNAGYGSIRLMQKRHFDENYVCCDKQSGMSLPDCREIAKAYGIKSTSITAKDNLREKIKEVLNSEYAVLCAVEVEPWLETAPRTSSFVKADGAIVSKPLEDLWPFLPREEFKANMLIKTNED